MGFFNKLVAGAQTPPKRRPASSPSERPTLGSGRSLRTKQTASQCLSTLEGLVNSYEPRKYEHLPAFNLAGAQWIGEAPAPQTVVEFEDGKDVLFAALWPTANGTDLGVFPLGSGDERLNNLPVIDDWRRRDPSMIINGSIPRGQMWLGPPPIPDDFVAETLRLPGYPDTTKNHGIVGRKLIELTLIKCCEYIQTQDPAAINRFLDAHSYTGGAPEPYLRAILDDLVDVNPSFVAYIQGMASRNRAFLLHHLAMEPNWLSLSG